MRRRTVLQAAVGTVTLPLFGPTTGAQDDPYEPLGSVGIEGIKEAAVHHDGDVAYVAVGDGFATVDITDPSTPTVLAERRAVDTAGNGPFRGAWDLWPSDDRLAVVGPANHAGNAAAGIGLFDISRPADPEQVAFFPTDYHIHNSFFADGTVYLTGTGLDPDPVVMVDVTGDEPREVGRWTLTDHDDAWATVRAPSRSLHDLYVQDGIAYLAYWDAGTWLVDVSDPTDVRFLGRVGEYSLQDLQQLDPPRRRFESAVPPGNHHYAQVDEDGDLLAVGIESWAIDTDQQQIGGPGGVHLYDVTDETDPQHRSTIEAPAAFDATRSGLFTTAHNLDLVDDRLYTSWYFGGVKIHDVSDPATPKELAWWREPRTGTFWTAQSAVPGEYFVAASAGDVGAELGVDHESVDPMSGLFLFPDRAGEQPSPPDLTTPPGGNGGQPGDTDGDDGTVAPDETDSGSQTDRLDPDTDNGSSEMDGSDGTGPGFGVGGAVAGLGGAGYLLARNLQRDEETSR